MKKIMKKILWTVSVKDADGYIIENRFFECEYKALEFAYNTPGKKDMFWQYI